MRVFLPLIVLGSFVIGCADSDNDGDNGEVVPDSELAVKFKAARARLTGGDPWDEATARIEERLGPPNVKTDTQLRWAASEGDECFELSLARGGVLENVVRVTFIRATADAPDEFERCRALAQSISAQ